METMYGWRARIGVIHPSMSITDIEELPKAAPEGVQFIFARLLIPGKFELANEEVTRAMLEHIEQAAKEVASANVQLIMQHCGAMSMFRGWGADNEIVTKIEAATGIPAVSMGTAEVEALHKLDMHRVVVFTPYEESINAAVEQYLRGAGIEVVLLKRLGVAREIIEISPYGIYRPIKDTYLKAPPNDGMILLGGAVRTFQIIQPLEYDTGKPVVTAIQASLWKALNMVSVREPIKGYGKLLQTF